MGAPADNRAMTDSPLTIRRADISDLGALAHLAALDSSEPPAGDSLLAEVGHELWAAVEISSGRAIADPFRPSGDLVELLRFRAQRMRAEASGQRRRFASLLPRTA